MCTILSGSNCAKGPSKNFSSPYLYKMIGPGADDKLLVYALRIEWAWPKEQDYVGV